jgi:ketosteroid isomerase-like protein
MTRHTLLAAISAILFGASSVLAQQTALQPKTPVERPLSPKDTAQEFTVPTKGNQRLTLTVQQHGIDVVVTVLGPDGKQLLEVDNASDDNGTGGSEIAHVTAITAGEYRVRITPFERPDAKPGKYTVTLSEMRDLTPAERANAESEREIADLEQQWEQARDKLDMTTLTRILRQDAFSMGPFAGSTRTRAQIVAGLEEESKNRQKRGSIRDHTIAERSIRAAGNVAVSTLRYVVTNTAKDRVSNRLSGQVVHVWAKDDTGWKLVGDYNFPFGRIPRQHGEPVTVDASALSSYAGTYRQENSPTTLLVTLDNATLHVQFVTDASTSPKLPLKAITDTTFTGFGNPNDEITFVRSPNGEVKECIFIGDGPAARAFRVK